jgi:hypothetical protein
VRSLEFGTTIETALSRMGVNHERVSRWIGAECGCRERRDRLNSLSWWAQRVVEGKIRDMGRFLQLMMEN